MSHRIKTLSIYISKERIVSKINGETCIDDEYGGFAIDELTLKVLASGTRAKELREGFDRRLHLAIIEPFDKGTVCCPKTVAADCLKGFVRRSFVMHGIQGLFRPRYDVVVCGISPECRDSDLGFIKRELWKEGARKVSFTSLSIDELQVTEDGRYDLDGSEIKAPRLLKPWWVFLMTLLAPWVLYFPLGLKLGGWAIHIQAWLLIELCIAAALIRGRRRALMGRLNRAKMMLPEMIIERRIAWIAVIGMMLVTAVVAFSCGFSQELSLMCRSTLYSLPLVIIWYQNRAIRLMRDDCFFLDRRMVFEADRLSWEKRD